MLSFEFYSIMKGMRRLIKAHLTRFSNAPLPGHEARRLLPSGNNKIHTGSDSNIGTNEYEIVEHPTRLDIESFESLLVPQKKWPFSSSGPPFSFFLFN